METKNFVNGFTSWVETHHEVVDYLTRTVESQGSMSHDRREEQGTGGLWELGEELTEEFEKSCVGKNWGEDDEVHFYDAIEDFLKEKENAHIFR